MSVEDDYRELEEAWAALKAEIRAELPMLATTAVWAWLTMLAIVIGAGPLL